MQITTVLVFVDRNSVASWNISSHKSLVLQWLNELWFIFLHWQPSQCVWTEVIRNELWYGRTAEQTIHSAVVNDGRMKSWTWLAVCMTHVVCAEITKKIYQKTNERSLCVSCGAGLVHFRWQCVPQQKATRRNSSSALTCNRTHTCTH